MVSAKSLNSDFAHAAHCCLLRQGQLVIQVHDLRVATAQAEASLRHHLEILIGVRVRLILSNWPLRLVVCEWSKGAGPKPSSALHLLGRHRHPSPKWNCKVLATPERVYMVKMATNRPVSSMGMGNA